MWRVPRTRTLVSEAQTWGDIRGGGLRSPGESWGILPGISGESGWGHLRGSPEDLSLGARGSPGIAGGRHFQGSSGELSLGARGKRFLDYKIIENHWFLMVLSQDGCFSHGVLSHPGSKLLKTNGFQWFWMFISESRKLTAATG